MRITPMRASFLASLPSVLLLWGTAAIAQQVESPSGSTWRPLFDGRSLDGWEHVGPGRMVLEEGRLRTEGGMGLLWYTRELVGDSVLRVVYKTTNKNSNSGVFIRIADKPKDPWFAVHHGYEIQISADGDEFHRTGAIYSLSKATASPSTVGEWNTMEITLDGTHVSVVLNGVKVQDFDPESAPVPERKKPYEPERGPRPAYGY